MHTNMAQVDMGVEMSMSVHWALNEYCDVLTPSIGEMTQLVLPIIDLG